MTKKNIPYPSGQVLKNTTENQVASRYFLELAQQAFYNKDILKATRHCYESISAYAGSAEIWKTLAACQPTEATIILLHGANKVTMPLKDRKALYKMVLIKEPENNQAQFFLTTHAMLKMKETIKQLKKKMEKLEAPTSIQPAPPIVSSNLPAIAFGKVHWATYLGDIGDEPPLPFDIHEILRGPCPFSPTKQLQETHLLVLIPKTIGGKPLTLNLLGELVQSPKQGFATKYRSFLDLGDIDIPVQQSHWVMITRDLVEESLFTQCRLKNYISYQVPSVLDITISIFMEYFRTGRRPYDDTYIICQEKHSVRQSNPEWPTDDLSTIKFLPSESTYSKERKLCVGCFTPDGLSLTQFGREKYGRSFGSEKFVYSKGFGIAGMVKL